MEKIYDKPTISITIFNENGLLGYHNTQWYFDKIMDLKINFEKVNDYSTIEDYPCDFEMFSQHLNIIIYRGGYVIVNCWGDTYDVLKMIVFFDGLIPQENDLFFSTYDGLVQEEEFRYKRGQNLAEFAAIIEKEYEGTYQLILGEELKRQQ